MKFSCERKFCWSKNPSIEYTGQKLTIKSFAKNANRQGETAKFNYKQACREGMFESSMQIKTTQKLRS